MRFRFAGDARRQFPSLSIEVDPGEIVEAETNPDPAFFVAVKDKG